MLTASLEATMVNQMPKVHGGDYCTAEKELSAHTTDFAGLANAVMNNCGDLYKLVAQFNNSLIEAGLLPEHAHFEREPGEKEDECKLPKVLDNLATAKEHLVAAVKALRLCNNQITFSLFGTCSDSVDSSKSEGIAAQPNEVCAASINTLAVLCAEFREEAEVRNSILQNLVGGVA
jgi:hypothetical protein